MAGQHSIIVTEGDTWNFEATVDTDGQLWDFTSYTAKMQVRESTLAGSKLYLDLSTSNYIALNSIGEIKITVPSSVMSSVKEGRYVYDMEFTSSAGQKTTLLSGPFVVEPQVTE